MLNYFFLTIFLCLAHPGQAYTLLCMNDNCLPSSFFSMGSLIRKPLTTGKVLYLGTFRPQKPHDTKVSLPLVFV